MTWLPSMVVKTMDQETLEHVTRAGAQQDLHKMLKAVKEFRLIKRTTAKSRTLKQMKELETEDEPDDEATQTPSNDFQTWAQHPDTTKSDVLAAMKGKGFGRGRQPIGKGGGRGRSAGATTSNRNGQPQGATPKQPTGPQRVETRDCYNCGEKGHLGKDCPLPDKRLLKQPGRASAKVLQQPDSEGFAPPPRLAAVQARRLRGSAG